MKQKDIVVIILVAGITGIVSLVAANFLFGGEKAYKLMAPKVDSINATFNMPEQKYFNKESVNPTKDINIGETTNDKPFNGGN